MTDLDTENFEAALQQLYTHAILFLKFYALAGPTIMALTFAFEKYDPELLKLFAEEQARANANEAFQALPQLIRKLEEDLKKLKIRRVN